MRDQEALLYGETCDPPKPFDFKDGGGNLVLRLRTNRDGWRADAPQKVAALICQSSRGDIG